MSQPLIDYCIAQGDDALIFGQRMTEWCYSAPFLEEDLALANVALDLIGRAQMFYQYAAELADDGRSADDIAFLRDARSYTNMLINELPRGDFAFSMARFLLVDTFNVLYLEQLVNSSDSRIAAIAAKAIKESRYHLRRSRDWVVRLGDGTEESHLRMQKGLEEVWGYHKELFIETAGERELIASGVAVDRQALYSAWSEQIDAVLAEATLQRPEDGWKVVGGRDGIHTEHLGHMLSEMQYLQRSYPGVEW